MKLTRNATCNRCALIRIEREAIAAGARVELRGAFELDEAYAPGFHVFVVPPGGDFNPRWRRKPASAGGDGLEHWHGPHWRTYFPAISSRCACEVDGEKA